MSSDASRAMLLSIKLYKYFLFHTQFEFFFVEINPPRQKFLTSILDSFDFIIYSFHFCDLDKFY